MKSYYIPKYSKYHRKKKSLFSKAMRLLLILIIIACVYFAYKLYKTIYQPNVWLNDKLYTSIYISQNASFKDVKTLLYKKGIIINRKSFEWLAKRKKYENHIKTGRYIIKANMNNKDLINMLRKGEQNPVKVIFHNIKTKQQFASVISKQIEADSSSIMKLLNDSAYLKKFDLNPKNVWDMFIPNTYDFYWNTDANSFFERMYKEYNKFWNKKKRDKAKEIGMTIKNVDILASIVEQETSKDDEKPRIAGVYINRLKRGWRLQADPTIIFAIGNNNIKRVLNDYKKIDSPYNTYKYRGLPPGPICLPSISSIDAVLNYEKHNYLYFCAKDDLSGYHNFAKTNAQQNLNASKYRHALNKLKIMK